VRRVPRRGALVRALSQMRQDLWLQGVAVSSLAVALAIVLAYMTLCYNLHRALASLSTGAAVVLALEDGVSPQAGRSLARQLAADAMVERARYVSKDEALRRFRRQLGRHRGLLEGLRGNPLPATVELVLRPGVDPEAGLTARLRELPGVAEVVTSRPWLQRLERAVGVGRELAAALGLLLFLGVVLLVANTVRLAVYVRRDQLEIMDLVGASTAYMRLPFLLESVIQALLASGLAVGLVWGLMELLATPLALPLGLDLRHFLGFPPLLILPLLGLAVLAALVGGLLGVGRALRPELL